MAISSIWTEPAGFSVDDASAAASGSAAAGGAAFTGAGAAVEGVGAALEAVGAAPGFAGAELDGSGLACVLLAASSPQREATIDLRARASSAFARGSLSGLIAPATVASGRGAVKTLVSCSARDCGNGSSARALAIEDCVLALPGGEAELAAGGEVSGAARAIFSAFFSVIFSLASPMYQQARLVERSTR
jgi:hypothetical protein